LLTDQLCRIVAFTAAPSNNSSATLRPTASHAWRRDYQNACDFQRFSS
jgi:hypothetical protein